MKIIGIVGSPRMGNTETMVRRGIEGVRDAGAEVEIILLRELSLKMCDGCLSCDETGICHFDDGMKEITEKLVNADGYIIGTPARWSLLSGNLKVFFDRLNPLAVSEKLKGKKVGIMAVGQSSPEDGESILLAASSIENFCLNADMEIIGTVTGYSSLLPNDIIKQPKVLLECYDLGKNLVNSFEQV